jgi:microtubule-associated protein-like 6
VKGALQPEIKSVCLSPDLKSLLVGTAGGEIYELTTKDAKITPNSKFQNTRALMKSHYAPNRKSLNEVWGLAVNPNDQD